MPLPSQPVAGPATRPNEAAPRRVLIADAHAEFRRFLGGFVRKRLGMRVVAELGDLDRCLEQVRACSPDIVLIDVATRGRDGVDAIRRIRSGHPGVRVIALSMYEDAPLVEALLGAGAAGFVVKDDVVDALPVLLEGLERRPRAAR